MIPLILRGLLIVAFVWWVLVHAGLVPSPFSRTTIRIRNGEINVAGADLAPRAKEHVADVVREEMLFRGFITISTGRMVRFSREVPAGIRQRLRNILLN